MGRRQSTLDEVPGRYFFLPRYRGSARQPDDVLVRPASEDANEFSRLDTAGVDRIAKDAGFSSSPPSRKLRSNIIKTWKYSNLVSSETVASHS